jgi:putative FmdB family regulatory protein
MPLHDYTCTSCGDHFERLVRGGRPSRVRCPTCRSTDVTRRFSGFAVAAATSTPSPERCGACGSISKPEASGESG